MSELVADPGVCIIQNLLQNPFHRLTFDEKKSIISAGRPQPEMKCLTTERKTHAGGRVGYTRHFNAAKIYGTFNWLTGSEAENKLFCWDCLLFDDNLKSVWGKFGYNNLNGLSNALKKHDSSQTHVRSFVKLTAFGKVRVDLAVNEQARLDVIQWNEKVTENREILRRLIDAVCYLAKHEAPFRGHDESESSLNRGMYVGFLDSLAKYDQRLKTHLRTATVFKGTSNHIQNDLIKAVSSVVFTQIKQELNNTTFVSILIDETTDAGNESQLSTVLRYVNGEGLARERFVGFKNVSAGKTAAALFDHVVDIVDEFKLEEKLVAQSYDGASVMAGQLTGLCTRVQERYPSAVFIHCFAHRLNLVLQKVCNNIHACRVFFISLPGIAVFFSKSPKRSEALKKYVSKKFPKIAPTRWIFTSRLVNTVSENLQQLLSFFNDVVENEDGVWEDDAIKTATGLKYFLEDFRNSFLVVVFAKLFAYTDTLYNILQTKQFDVGFCYSKVKETKKAVEAQRSNFDAVWKDFQKKRNECELSIEPPAMRRARQDLKDPRESFRRLFFEIIDHISQQLTDRFASMEKLNFLDMLNWEKYKAHQILFPEACFQALKQSYPATFDFVRLRNELAVMYSLEGDEFGGKMPHKLVSDMRSDGLHKGMPELYKLACLFLTIPCTTASVERSFSALKRIKSYSRVTQGQQRLSHLALLSIEKDVLCQLEELPDFYSKVTDEFDKQERRMEFTYK